MIKDTIIKILEEKKAIDIISLEVGEKSTLADTFIVASGTSTTHVKSLSDNIEKELKDQEIYAKKIEGYSTGRWILMDYSEVIVHIFHPEEREFYNLEDLWKDSLNKLEN